MLLGMYKNFDELEDSITLDELEALLTEVREREFRAQKFAAALKGIDLDGESEEYEDAEDRMELIKARVDARLNGEDPEEAEFGFFGIDFETE